MTHRALSCTAFLHGSPDLSLHGSIRRARANWESVSVTQRKHSFIPTASRMYYSVAKVIRTPLTMYPSSGSPSWFVSADFSSAFDVFSSFPVSSSSSYLRHCAEETLFLIFSWYPSGHGLYMLSALSPSDSLSLLLLFICSIIRSYSEADEFCAFLPLRPNPHAAGTVFPSTSAVPEPITARRFAVVRFSIPCAASLACTCRIDVRVTIALVLCHPILIHSSLPSTLCFSLTHSPSTHPLDVALSSMHHLSFFAVVRPIRIVLPHHVACNSPMPPSCDLSFAFDNLAVTSTPLHPRSLAHAPSLSIHPWRRSTHSNLLLLPPF